MEATSLGDMLRRSCARWGDKTAMLVPEKSDFRPITYTQLYELAHRYAGVIRGLGLQKGDRMVILSENCVEWALADWGCQTLGVIVVPIYPTLPPDQAQYIVKDCGAKVALAGSPDLAKKIQGMEGVSVVPLRGSDDSVASMAEAGNNPIPSDEWEKAIDAVGIEEVATIIYTSGTTGLPKGAMLAHKGFLMIFDSIVNNVPLGHDDIFICFLPMSHVFERTDGQLLPISLGATIGYAKSLASLAGDILKIRPTVILCVPRFLEATMEKIVDGVKKQPPMKQRLFGWALDQGKRKFRGQLAPFSFLTDALVGKKIRERFGGRLRFFVSGGAALPSHVEEFFGAFGIKVQQGYGLTETYSGVCINHPDRNRPGTVGEVLPGVELKIAGDGEILFRGAARMIGYYNLPEETKASIDEDGWFHTGDIGEMQDGYLKITDRKKDLLVLGNGKNVAPQPIENKLRESPYIQEAVVLGDGMDHCVALIVPNFEHIKHDLRLDGAGDLAENPEVKKLIKDEVNRINKTLAGFEMVKKHALLSKPFTVESGEMTPTLKVKRKVVKERYADAIAGLKN